MFNFPHIHPFSNDNGHVSRLVVSYILMRESIIPVTLTSVTNVREIYLICLRDAQNASIYYGKPTHLSRLILESIWKTYLNVCYHLDLEEIQ